MILGLISLIVKSLVRLLQILGFGGTALPGLWVEKYLPWLISVYAKRYGKVILITGTNGKTTTQLALAKILETAGLKVVANLSGSNMLRGIATVLMTAGPVPRENTVLLCEVEEATMPKLTQLLSADIIVVTNMYRDQLDAYGELDTTAEYIRTACIHSANATLVLNSDDPVITGLAAGLPHKKITYSLGEFASQFQYEGRPGANREIVGSVQSTPGTSMHPDITTNSITVKDDLSTETELSYRGVDMKIGFNPPGEYNVYNLLATYAVAQVLGLHNNHIMQGLALVQAPFGRGEVVHFEHQGRSLTFRIFLVKNPAGYTQVWDMLREIQTPFNLILGLNDQIADGQDVSWIWDIDLHPISRPNTLQLVIFTGRRAHDMALRLKYADIEGTGRNTITNIQSCLNNVVQKTNDGRECFVLMTYTAMNEFRSALGTYVTMIPYSL